MILRYIRMNPERSVLRIRTGNYFKTTVAIRSIKDRDETDKNLRPPFCVDIYQRTSDYYPPLRA